MLQAAIREQAGQDEASVDPQDFEEVEVHVIDDRLLVLSAEGADHPLKFPNTGETTTADNRPLTEDNGVSDRKATSRAASTRPVRKSRAAPPVGRERRRRHYFYSAAGFPDDNHIAG